jgi:hypothetical protein
MIFSFTSANVFSQQNEKAKRTPEERATKMADRMKQNLTLSDDQYKQVYNLFLSKAQEMKGNKEKFKSMDKEARKQMKLSNREAFQKELTGILNPDQMKKFQDNMDKYKKNKNKKHKQKEESNQ